MAKLKKPNIPRENADMDFYHPHEIPGYKYNQFPNRISRRRMGIKVPMDPAKNQQTNSHLKKAKKDPT